MISLGPSAFGASRSSTLPTGATRQGLHGVPRRRALNEGSEVDYPTLGANGHHLDQLSPMKSERRHA